MGDKALKVNLRDLPARTGAFVDYDIDWTVGEGWATEVVTLEPGTIVPLHVVATSIDDGVLIQVSASGQLEAECVRCLDPIRVPWQIDTADVYYEPGKEQKAAQKAQPSDEGEYETEGDEFDAVRLIDKDSVNLDSLLRDAIFDDAPFQPVCSEDCLGLCGHCGIRLSEAEPDHKHEFVDPRFAALADFFEVDDENNDSSAEWTAGS